MCKNKKGSGFCSRATGGSPLLALHRGAEPCVLYDFYYQCKLRGAQAQE